MTEGTWENPALNPTRKWDDTPEVRLHLRFIVKKHVARIGLLRRLIEGPVRGMSQEDVDGVVFLNEIANAYGYVDLIVDDGDVHVLDPGARAQLPTVLSADYRGGV
jgi:hypothetical protein